MESEKNKKENLKIFILVLYAAYSQMGYSLLAPLYPFEAQQRGVSSTLIGLIFSSFGVSNFIFTILTPLLIRLFGRKTILIFGLLTEGICTCFFGLISLVNNKLLFVSISFLIRFAQGMGAATIQILLYSIVASISSKENKEKNIGYIEFGDSIGVAIGPLVASLSCHLFGFMVPFLLAGFIEMTGILLIKYLEINKKEKSNEKISDEEQINLLDKDNGKETTAIESDDDEESEEESDEEESESSSSSSSKSGEEEKENKNEPNLIKIFVGNVFIFLIFLSVLIDSLSLSVTYPVFSIYLYNKFKISEGTTSLFFIIQTVGYFCALQFIGPINRILKNKRSMVLGIFLNGIFILFLAPVSFLPQKIFVIIIGLFCLGIAGAFVSIPAIIENIDIINLKLGYKKSVSEDYSSSIYNLGYYLGETSGPLVGGFFTDKFGFPKCCAIVSCINILLFVCFYSSVLVEKFKKNSIEEKKNKENEELIV